MFLPKHTGTHTHTPNLYYCCCCCYEEASQGNIASCIYGTYVYVVGKHPRAELKFIEALINDNANNSLST